MADVPDYLGLEPQWQADCHNWNSNITATNHRRPALSSPPPFLKLFKGGHDTYDELKADLDEATMSAGWLAVARTAKPKRKILECSRGTQRPSTATQNNATTIKVNCKWRATAHTTKETCGKWKLLIEEGVHTYHGPQEVPEAQRGWVKLTNTHHEFLARTAQNPSLAKPKLLESILLREYPGVKLGPNTMKDWLANFRQGRVHRTRANEFRRRFLPICNTGLRGIFVVWQNIHGVEKGRVVADLRPLNKWAVPDNHPPPLQKDIIDSLRGKKYITVIDATAFFFQSMALRKDFAEA